MTDRERPALLGPRRVRGSEKISETIAREIVNEIVKQELQPGTILPSEAAMLESWQVGRGSLREALRILEVHGLIHIKPGPGGGPVVAEVSARDFGRTSTLYFQVARATFEDLVEARLAMEPMMARLAARRTDGASRRELEAVVEAPGATTTDSDYMPTATSFHDVVASMSGNRVLDLFSSALKEIYWARISTAVFRAEDHEATLDVHREIADAILRGHAVKAERLMHEHMLEYRDRIFSQFPGLVDELVRWR